MNKKSLLPLDWDFPKQFRGRLGTSVGHQRALLADGHLLLVMHAPPTPDDTERGGRYFWRDIDGVWKSNDHGDGIQAITLHLAEYADRIAAIDQQEEQATTADDYFQVLDRLAPVYRAARHAHEVLQEARRLCPDDPGIVDVRNRAYAIERTAELLFNGAKNSLEFTVAKGAEQQAQASQRMAEGAHRLNILAAFFFPIVTLTAVFGVDLETVAACLRLDVNTVLSNRLVPWVFLGLMPFTLIVGGVLARFVNPPPRT